VSVDEVDKVFHSFLENGLLEPDHDEAGRFLLSPTGLVFIDSMMQIYGLCGLSQRMNQLVQDGRFEDLADSIKTRLLH
jgi:hypothetical protein